MNSSAIRIRPPRPLPMLMPILAPLVRSSCSADGPIPLETGVEAAVKTMGESEAIDEDHLVVAVELMLKLLLLGLVESVDKTVVNDRVTLVEGGSGLAKTVPPSEDKADDF